MTPNVAIARLTYCAEHADSTSAEAAYRDAIDIIREIDEWDLPATEATDNDAPNQAPRSDG